MTEPRDAEMEQVRALYVSSRCREPESITALPGSGSYRRYFRIVEKDGTTLIGAFNSDVRENEAFFHLARHFAAQGLPVPALYEISADRTCYLQQDLGDTTLLAFLQQHDIRDTAVGTMYRKVLQMLLSFQTAGSRGLDFSRCFPRAAFDRRAMMWDLNYFKYHFLKLLRVPFDEQLLEDDFESLCSFLLSAGTDCFMYRDFQSRNVMVAPDGRLYGIDFQGGRAGALPYDVASLLFESKTALPPAFREELLQYYCSLLSDAGLDDRAFMKYFYGFVYIRLMQAMGAYGFRGLYEQKPLFVQSIPGALETMAWLGAHVTLPVRFPELEKVWQRLAETDPSSVMHKKC